LSGPGVSERADFYVNRGFWSRARQELPSGWVHNGGNCRSVHDMRDRQKLRIRTAADNSFMIFFGKIGGRNLGLQ
jgi:hypothetical protein